MRKTVIDDFIFLPDSNDIVFLTVIIGDIDQTGSTRLEIIDGEHSIVQNFNGSFYDHPVGPSKKLNKKILLITTSVTDTNKDTSNNRTEVVLKIIAGTTAQYVKRVQSDVANEGDTETFIFNISCYV